MSLCACVCVSNRCFVASITSNKKEDGDSLVVGWLFFRLYLNCVIQPGAQGEWTNERVSMTCWIRSIFFFTLTDIYTHTHTHARYVCPIFKFNAKFYYVTLNVLFLLLLLLYVQQEHSIFLLIIMIVFVSWLSLLLLFSLRCVWVCYSSIVPIYLICEMKVLFIWSSSLSPTTCVYLQKRQQKQQNLSSKTEQQRKKTKKTRKINEDNGDAHSIHKNFHNV